MTTPSVVNSATNYGTTGTTLGVTLDAAPTAGNLLVICIAERKDGGDTVSFSQGSWTQVETTAYSGSATNWPHWMYYMVATAGMSATTTVTFGGSGAAKEINIVEIADANTLDTSRRNSNTSTCTGTLTPTASAPIALVSNTFARTDSIPFNLTAGGSMGELENNQRCALNSQMVASASGSYTVGSTGNGANSSMLGAAFRYVAPPATGRSVAIIL